MSKNTDKKRYKSDDLLAKLLNETNFETNSATESKDESSEEEFMWNKNESSEEEFYDLDDNDIDQLNHWSKNPLNLPICDETLFKHLWSDIESYSTSIATLDLSNNNIGDSNGYSLELLQEFNIGTLNLSCNLLNDNAIPYIIEACNSEKIWTINLANNFDITDQGWFNLINSIDTDGPYLIVDNNTINSHNSILTQYPNLLMSNEGPQQTEFNPYLEDDQDELINMWLDNCHL